MSKIKQYKDLENTLIHKIDNIKENVIYLGDEDFKDGKLSSSGYNSLKHQSEYIPFREEIEITVPKKYAVGLKDTLESKGVRELSYNKKDRFYNAVVTLVLLFVGVFWVAASILIDSLDVAIIKEITIIASWVFVWAAVEKWFFERRALSEKRYSILQILSAKIIIKD